MHPSVSLELPQMWNTWLEGGREARTVLKLYLPEKHTVASQVFVIDRYTNNQDL